MTESESAGVIERLEKATGPDRAIDIAIFKFIRPRTTNHDALTDQQREGWWETFAPRYTESIDAAVMLVPSGLYWLISYGKTRPDEPLGAAQIIDHSGKIVAEAEAATVALSVGIAALKARSTP